MKRKVGLVELDISAGHNLLCNEIIDFVSLLAIGVTKKDTRMSPGGKFVFVVFRSGDKTKRTKGSKMRIGRRLSM